MSFAAVGHLETAEFIAKKCGTYTVETVSRTLAPAGRSSRARLRVTRPDHAAGGDAGHARRRPDRVRQGSAADPLRPRDFLPARGDEGAGRREPVSSETQRTRGAVSWETATGRLSDPGRQTAPS